MVVEEDEDGGDVGEANEDLRTLSDGSGVNPQHRCQGILKIIPLGIAG